MHLPRLTPTCLRLTAYQVSLKLFHDYHAASPDSRAFKSRLVEIVAVSIHQIAVTLYKLDLSLGNHRDWAAWVAPTSDKVFYWGHPDGKLPTLFYHDQYQERSQYSEGIADMVGYWAESQIFGGVVLFDRRRPDEREPHEDVSFLPSSRLLTRLKAANSSQPDALYFHSDRKMVAYRIWQLLDTQKKQLLDFLLAEHNTVPSPFPILADDNNLTRIDPEEPIRETGIYRDLWERKPLGDDDGDSQSHCCAYNCLDYPSIADYKRSRQRYWDRKAAKEEKKEEEREAMEREEEAEGAVDEEEDDDDEVARVLKRS